MHHHIPATPASARNNNIDMIPFLSQSSANCRNLIPVPFLVICLFSCRAAIERQRRRLHNGAGRQLHTSTADAITARQR